MNFKRSRREIARVVKLPFDDRLFHAGMSNESGNYCISALSNSGTRAIIAGDIRRVEVNWADANDHN